LSPLASRVDRPSAGVRARDRPLAEEAAVRVELLDPVAPLADDHRAVVSHRDRPGVLELPVARAVTAPRAVGLAVRVEDVDAVGVGIGDVDQPVGAHVNAARPGEPRARTAQLTLEPTVRVEDLDAAILAVGHVDQPVGADSDVRRVPELPRLVANAAPGALELAV